MAVAVETNQFLTFTLDKELYAVEVVKVREVLEVKPVTKIPRMPDYMKGVINIRGNVVPVLSLRLKFAMEEIDYTKDTCIIVMDIASGEGNVTIGCLADSVQEVIDLDPEQIEPPPRIGTRVDASIIKGMGKREEEFLIILDTDKVFTSEDIMAAEAVAKTPGAKNAETDE
jgi:purine-binding chemotaxis protein CheW